MQLPLELDSERLDVKPKSLLLVESGPSSFVTCESLCKRIRCIEGTGKTLAGCGVNRTILTLQNILVASSRSKALLDPVHHCMAWRDFGAQLALNGAGSRKRRCKINES